MSKVRGNLIIVSAPSGGGKTSLTRAALRQLNTHNHPATLSISYTTRPPRPGENNGEHYHFVSKVEFEKMVSNNAFLEYAEVFGNFYGTGKKATEDLLAAGIDVIFDIDWQGARQIKQQIETAIGIFILPPSRAELEKRLTTRGQDSAEVISQRMQEARDEMRHYQEYDYLLVNDDFDRALDELLCIIKGLRARQTNAIERHSSLLHDLIGLDS